MKLRNFLLLLSFFAFGTAFGQRFCVVDSKFILESMAEFQEAQTELNEMSKKWQETIEAKYADLDRLSKAYQAEKILLTPDMQKKRESEIETKRKEALDYQRQKFGVEGELFKKRMELIQPLQDRIFDAIKDVAKERSYAVIFDKATNSNLLYTDPKYDKSDLVIRKLGLSD